MMDSPKGSTDVIIGIELSGHYWFNLAYFLKERGIPLVMTNLMQSSVRREEKNEIRDYRR